MGRKQQWRNRITGYGEEAPDQLLANPGNWRTHPANQQDALAGVLSEVGIVQNVIVNQRTGYLVDGHLRVMLARRNEQPTIPVTYVDLSEAEEAEILATLDPIAALAAADAAKLGELLESVSSGDAAVQAMLSDLAEREGVLDALGGTQGLTDPDEVPEPPVDPITQPGDLWLLGRHRLLCGDSTVESDVRRLMAGEHADVVFTSPPYLNQREYGGGIQPWDELMRGVFANIPDYDRTQVLVNLGLVHRDGEWLSYWDGWIEWMRETGWRRFGWYVWDQGSGLPGDWNGRFAPSHEFLFHFNRASVTLNKTVPTKLGGQKKTGNGLRKEDGTVGAWTHAGRLVQPTKVLDSVVRINRHSTFQERIDHPAVYPVALVTEVVPALCEEDAVIFDPFLGSGTTLMACERINRPCFGIELNPVYCDVIVRRWEQFTGETASRERVEAMAAD